MSKKRMITKSVIFLLILAFILKIFSSLSIAMGYNANPLYNYSSYSIFQEPDNSIDVLSIGDSNVYSSIFPLVWWEQQGFTGYTWGQPSQRIPETYEYLKKIIYVFLTIFLYLLKCPQSLILSALRAFCFCGKPHISRSIFLYFRYQAWLKSW